MNAINVQQKLEEAQRNTISRISVRRGRRCISDYKCLRIKIHGLFLFKKFRLNVGLLPTPGIVRHVF